MEAQSVINVAENLMSASDLSDDFKHAMRRLPGAVGIVSCRGKDQNRHGMTATSITSLCAKPPSLLVCVNTGAPFHDAMSSTEKFCVNILSHSQQDVSQSFGGKIKGDEKFNVGDWTEGPFILPVLSGAQANLICQTDKFIHYGTHTIFIGRVLGVSINGQYNPLVYGNGTYATQVPIS